MTIIARHLCSYFYILRLDKGGIICEAIFRMIMATVISKICAIDHRGKKDGTCNLLICFCRINIKSGVSHKINGLYNTTLLKNNHE
jgi:hypothetical protein